MNRTLVRTLILLTCAGLAGFARAQEPCPHCQSVDGCWEEIITHRCRIVPDVKKVKKTIYECKEVPFCLHQLPKFGHCDTCPQCQACPRYKKVLLKKEIVSEEICGTKCIVEEVIERVPRKCCQALKR